MKHILSATLALLCISASLQAQVIGYWRFENGGNATTLGLDSSGNSRDLSNVVAAGSVTSLTTLGAIPSTIPQTSASNTRLISISGTNQFAFYRADETAFYQTSFTIEAYFRATSNSTFGHIASQSGTGQDQWRLGFNSGSGVLAFGLSGNGSGFVPFNLTVAEANSNAWVNKDIYVAAAVNVTGSGTTVNWYYQNLTDNGTLQSATTSNATFTSLWDSTAAFNIGGTNTSATVNPWRGRIDEVRFSQGVLSSSQLLQVVPEPSTLALLASTLTALVAFRRRRRV